MMQTSPETCEMLLSAKAEVNLPSPADGRTALHHAAGGGADVGVVAVLLFAKAAVNSRTRDGRTPLHCVVTRRNDVECGRVIDMLVYAGADINAVTSAGETVLQTAAVHESLELVHTLLAQQPSVDLNARSPSDGTTALMATCAANMRSISNASVSIISDLVKAKAQVNTGNTDTGMTPLIAAVHMQRPEVVELLLKARANVEARTIAGE